MKYLCSVCTMIDDGVTKQVLALRICSSSCSWASCGAGLLQHGIRVLGHLICWLSWRDSLQGGNVMQCLTYLSNETQQHQELLECEDI